MEHMTEARARRNVVRIAVIAGVGGLLFGYDTGIISGALLFIRDDFDLSAFQQGVVTSSLLVGAVFGSLYGGWLSDRYGRRSVVLLAAVIFGVGALMAGLAPNYPVLVAARVVLGLGVGTASLLVPLYIAELAPPKARGALVSLTSLMTTTGILLSYMVAYGFADMAGWRWMLGIGLIPSVVLGVGMLVLPETPRWLLIRGRDSEARDVLRHTRQGEAVEPEMREIAAVAREETGGFRDLFHRNLRPLLVVGAGLAVMQQITGVNTVIYFAPTILEEAGFGAASAILATFGVGAANVLMTVVAILVVDRLGRRRLLLWGTLGMAGSLFFLGLAFGTDAPGFLLVALLMVYISVFAVSLGPVVWLLLAEIFPLRVRGAAMSFGSALLWAANFVVALVFLPMAEAITASGAFWVYTAICVLSFLFVLFKVPETKGRTLEEIEAELRGPRTRGRFGPASPRRESTSENP